MSTTTGKTRCETVDLTVPWTDNNGNLQIHEGDLVRIDGRFEQVAKLHWDTEYFLNVVVRFDGHDEFQRRNPAEQVEVFRYIEHTEE